MITSLNKDFGVPLTENEIKCIKTKIINICHLFWIFLVFSIDDRIPLAPSPPPPPTEEENKITENNYSSNVQLVEEKTLPSADDIQRPDINFLRRNKERVRLASLRNKYEWSHMSNISLRKRNFYENLVGGEIWGILYIFTRMIEQVICISARIQNHIDKRRTYLSTQLQFHLDCWSFHVAHRHAIFYADDRSTWIRTGSLWKCYTRAWSHDRDFKSGPKIYQNLGFTLLSLLMK